MFVNRFVENFFAKIRRTGFPDRQLPGFSSPREEPREYFPLHGIIMMSRGDVRRTDKTRFCLEVTSMKKLFAVALASLLAVGCGGQQSGTGTQPPQTAAPSAQTPMPAADAGMSGAEPAADSSAAEQPAEGTAPEGEAAPEKPAEGESSSSET